MLIFPYFLCALNSFWASFGWNIWHSLCKANAHIFNNVDHIIQQQKWKRVSWIAKECAEIKIKQRNNMLSCIWHDKKKNPLTTQPITMTLMVKTENSQTHTNTHTSFKWKLWIAEYFGKRKEGKEEGGEDIERKRSMIKNIVNVLGKRKP